MAGIEPRQLSNLVTGNSDFAQGAVNTGRQDLLAKISVLFAPAAFDALEAIAKAQGRGREFNIADSSFPGATELNDLRINRPISEIASSSGSDMGKEDPYGNKTIARA